MDSQIPITRCFVVKTEELIALNYLPENAPEPAHIEWIDRGTDRPLSPSRLDQLMRTYHRTNPSPSVAKLRDAAGVRAIFQTDVERNEFACALATARSQEQDDRDRLVRAIFPTLKEAESAAHQLLGHGVPESAISILWQANRYMDPNVRRLEGYKASTVVAGVSAGGLVAAVLGTAILAVPGLGPVVVAGAVVTSAYTSVATASGIIGATGAALATMLSDPDVDGIARNHREEQLRRGMIFMAVDANAIAWTRKKISDVLEISGGLSV